MPCFHPITAYRSRDVMPSGKRRIVFSPREGYADMTLKIPCGQCYGCRLEKARQWTVRCMHEQSLHEDNCFITLTYNNESLPYDKSLSVDELQRFWKRLRKKLDGKEIRYYACGEYGGLHMRPHYHAIIFGWTPDDITCYSINGKVVYVSKILQEAWPYGYHTVGDVTWESTSYVARYIQKKITGQKAESHYINLDKVTGEIYNEIKPEFTLMSRRPGIARKWYEENKKEVYPSDSVIVKERECKPPRYYDNLYDIDYPEEMAIVKGNRKRKAEKNPLSDEELIRREKVMRYALQETNKKRSYENENLHSI